MDKEAPRFAYGIPTRADVRDHRHQDLVRRHELEMKTMALEPSPGPLRRYIHEALLRAGDATSNPFEILKTGVYRPSVGQRWSGVAREFRDSLNPSSIFEQLMERIGSYEKAVDEARPFLPNFDRVLSITLPERVRPLSWAPLPWAQMTEEKKTADGKGWVYTYVPEFIFKREMGWLRHGLQAAMRRDDSLRQLQGLGEVLHGFESDVVWQKFLKPALRFDERRDYWDLEADRRTEAGRLSREHARIAMESDVFVTFDLKSLILRKNEPGLGNEHVSYEDATYQRLRMTAGGLIARTKVRDYIQRKLEEEGRVVINGVTVRRRKEGTRMVLGADLPLPLYLVNLLPISVYPEAVVITDEDGGSGSPPQEWAVKEARLVSEYRALPVDKALGIPYSESVKAILFNYEGFAPRGEKTLAQEKVRKLLMGLRHQDWLKYGY